MNAFEQKIADFIASEGLIADGDRLVAAVSGGADSVAVLVCLCRLVEEGVLNCGVSACHVNHCLRGAESDGDEDYVKKLCGKLGVELFAHRVDVTDEAARRGESLETAARQVRMEVYREACQKAGAEKIVTAHHKGDNAETIVHRLERGTGYRGLAGIWPLREFEGYTVVRPGLCVSRNEIVEYLSEMAIKWRTDRSNKDISFRRNYIRHELFAALERDAAESLEDELFELARCSQKLNSKISQEAKKFLAECMRENEGQILIDVTEFRGLFEPVQVEVTRLMLEKIGCGERNIKEEHYRAIIGLAQGAKGGIGIDLPGDFIVHRDFGGIVFEKTRHLEGEDESIKIEIGGTKIENGLEISSRVLERQDADVKQFFRSKDRFAEWFDMDKVKGDIYIRPREEGDSFYPIGLGAEKKVGKFLTDQKVGRGEKRDIRVVIDGEDIMWVWPLRADGRYRITEGTERILEIDIRRESEKADG